MLSFIWRLASLLVGVFQVVSFEEIVWKCKRSENIDFMGFGAYKKTYWQREKERDIIGESIKEYP